MTEVCVQCGLPLGPHDDPPFGPPRHFVCPELPGSGIQVGYHRKSDDSVSSGFWQPGPLRNQFIQELLSDPDVDRAWFRTSDRRSSTGLSEPKTLKEN